MNFDDFEKAAEAAKALAETDFAGAEAALLKLLPEAKAADTADPEYSSCTPTVLDALGEIHVRKAVGYWKNLVEAMGGDLGSCMTCDNFPEYCWDRAGLRPLNWEPGDWEPGSEPVT